jgi:dTDP-4-amino-4,6-dideoxygalactose transaminase
MSLHGLSHDAGLIYESRKLGLQIALRFKYNLTDAVAAIGLRQLVRSEESCPERINR